MSVVFLIIIQPINDLMSFFFSSVEWAEVLDTKKKIEPIHIIELTLLIKKNNHLGHSFSLEWNKDFT